MLKVKSNKFVLLFIILICVIVSWQFLPILRTYLSVGTAISIIFAFIAIYPISDSLRFRLLTLCFLILGFLLFILPIKESLLPIGDVKIYYDESLKNYALNDGPWLSEPIVRLLMLPSQWLSNGNAFFIFTFVLLLAIYICLAKRLAPKLGLSCSLLFLVLVCDRSIFTYESFWVIRQYISAPLIFAACVANRRGTAMFCLLLAFLAHNSSIIFYVLYLISKYGIYFVEKLIFILKSLRVPRLSLYKIFYLLIFITTLTTCVTLFWVFKSYNLANNFTGDTIDSGLKTDFFISGVLLFSIHTFIKKIMRKRFAGDTKLLYNIACIYFIPALIYFVAKSQGDTGLFAYRISWFFYPMSGLLKLLGLYTALRIGIILNLNVSLRDTLKILLAITFLRFPFRFDNMPSYFINLKNFYRSPLL